MKSTNRIAQTIALVAILFVCGPAWAQTSNGTLVGAVTDPTGAVVPKATVSAISTQYGQPHEGHTDQAGTYRMESLQQGVYTVTFTATGFTPLTVTGVVINGSLTTTINGKLELGVQQQTVEVKATALQGVDTQSGELGEDIAPVEVQELPYSSFNPAELAMTLPGVHDVPAGTSGGGYTGGVINASVENGIVFSVNGTRPRSNNFLIDGQDDNDYTITGQAYQPTNYGAIQEVAILTNAYSAEYGRGGGSVTNYIYKSGTNDFHGNLWEVNQNSAVASVPPQDTFSNPQFTNPFYNENTFGFAAGGPVKKDKLFLFGTAQWDITHQDVTGPPSILPTAAGIATLQSLAPSYPNIGILLTSLGGLESPALNSVQTCPAGATNEPNGQCLIPLGSDPSGNPRPGVEVGNFQFQNVLTKSHATSWNVRGDWQMTNNDKLTVSAIRSTQNISPDNFANPDALPNFQTQQGGPAGIYWTQWVHTLSSNLVNEMRFSFTSIDFTFAETPSTAAFSQANLPYITFGTDIDFPGIGINDDFPQGRGHHTYQYQDSLSWTSGRHTLKAGVDLTFLRLHDILPLDTRGEIEYNSGGVDPVSGNQYNSLANFIDDYTGATPASIGKTFGQPNLYSSANMFALFIQDTWRIKNNLTIDAGLRYEYWGALANSLAYPAFNIDQGVGILNITNPADYADALSFKQVPDKRNFGPRLGIAYTPHWGKWLGDGKTVFRAGYGIFYDGLFTNITGNSEESEPNTLGGDITGLAGRGQPNAMATLAAIGPQANPDVLIDSMQSNLHNPMVEQWNANIQRELPLGLLLTVAYVGTRGEHLFARQDFNPAEGVNLNTFSYVYTNPIFSEFAVQTSGGDSKYNSGQIEVERKLRSLTLRAAYSYSHYEDDASEILSLSDSIGLPSFAQNLTNQSSDWGNSNFDQRHRLTISYVADLPYFHGNTLLRAITDQWEWSGIATLETGTPNQVEDGFDDQFNGHANSRPDLENPNAPLNMVGIDESNVWANLSATPGTFVDLSCAYFTAGPCTPRPESAYHFIIPTQTVTAAGIASAPPGNVGRNTLYGPGQVYFDTAIQRDFPIHLWKLENQVLSFRTEFFNAFNHPNLFTPSYTLTDPFFNNTAVTVAGGRTIKFWLKYSF